MTHDRVYDCVIVGAGIAGLTLAYLLTKAGKNILIVEKTQRVGGLAKSFTYRFRGKKFIFDVGPKRFHTKDAEVLSFIYKILGKDFIETGRKSSIYAFGKYFNWPLTLKDLFKVPFTIKLEMGIDFLGKITGYTNSKSNSQRFDTYIIERYGKSLYKYFFEKYTSKFICMPANRLSKDWAETGINRSIIDDKTKGGSAIELAKSILLPVAVKTRFVYPSNGGFGNFCQRLASLIMKNGGKILTRSEVGAVNYQNRNLTVGKSNIKFKKLVWTGNIHDLEKLLDLEESKLQYLSTIFYNFIIRTSKIRDDQWIYYHYGKDVQSELTMVRSSIPRNFASYLIPKGYQGICVEKTCHYNDFLWKNPKTLIKLITQELVQVGLISSVESVANVYVEPVKDTYPIYELGYQVAYKKFATKVKRVYPQIKLLGRLGTFWYNNTDHSIKAAIEMSKYLQGKRTNEPDKHNIF